MAASILIVDDDPGERRRLEADVGRFGHPTLVACGGEHALDLLAGAEAASIAAIVLDLVMPGLDGIGMLQAMRRRGISIPVVARIAGGGADSVARAMREGAFDCVVEPTAPGRLKAVIAGALEAGVPATDGRSGRRGGIVTFKDIVGGNQSMERAVRLARKAAASGIPVLIEGESGAGKEFLARAIHGAGGRRMKPFVTVNCGAIPGHLVDGILFGRPDRASPGGLAKHPGKFAEARSGTLFLDEIGELPSDVQVELLGAVRDGEVDSAGEPAAGVRLIAASRRDLLQQVRDGKFREDLYWRLSVCPIHVPPLRDRRGDIPGLVRHFMAQGTRKRGSAPPIAAISERALAMLQAYDWPGNVRQLRNAVRRAVSLCEGEVLTEGEFEQVRAEVEGAVDRDGDAAAVKRAVAPGSPRRHEAVRRPAEAAKSGVLRALDERGNVRALADVEKEMIELAIEHHRGRMSEVARRLGIGRSTLYRKLEEHGIDSRGRAPDPDGSRQAPRAGALPGGSASPRKRRLP